MGAGCFSSLQRVVELDRNDLDARVKLARIMVGGGAAEAAARLLEAANDSDKPNASLHALKANILLRTKDPAGAIREALRALEIDPKNIDASLLIAAKRASDGEVDGALKLLSELQVSDSQDELRVAQQKIAIFVRQGDVVQAESLLHKLISENPKVLGLRAQLIQLYLAAKRFEDVEQELRVMVDLVPTDSKAGMDLVRFLIASKGIKAGREALDARIRAGGDVFDYQIALAEINFADNNLTVAAQSLQNLSYTATSPERKLLAQAKLAEMYVNKANVAAAEPIIADILEKDRHNTNGLRLRRRD